MLHRISAVFSDLAAPAFYNFNSLVSSVGRKWFPGGGGGLTCLSPRDLRSRYATSRVCKRDDNDDDDDDEIEMAYFSVRWKTRKWDHKSETEN